VAELTILSFIALHRRVRSHWVATAEGGWPDRDHLDDRELAGKTVGLVGLGRVGSRVATRLRPFGCQLLAVDPFVEPHVFEAVGAERVESLDALLPRVHVLSLHCPLAEATRGLLDRERLAALPEGAYVVNTARGGLIDEASLEEALDAERLGGAALDVFAVEPPPVGGLASHPRVLATPHLAGHTRESHAARARNLARALEALLDSLAGDSPRR
jgi:phosphoglycerate dehydrogenase-like enzyme